MLLFPCVGEHVSLQVLDLVKRFAALWTIVVLFFRVSEHVSLQGLGEVKRFAALSTIVLLFSTVDYDMGSQITSMIG